MKKLPDPHIVLPAPLLKSNNKIKMKDVRKGFNHIQDKFRMKANEIKKSSVVKKKKL